MISFKMLLFLFFLYLIKYSQRNINMSHYDYTYFSFLLYFLILLHVSLFLVVRCLMVYNVYLLCELYLLSLKIFIFFHLKVNN